MPFTTATISFPNPDKEFGCRPKLWASPPAGDGIDGCGSDDDCGSQCEDAGQSSRGIVQLCIEVPEIPAGNGYKSAVDGGGSPVMSDGGHGGGCCSADGASDLFGYIPSIGGKTVRLAGPDSGPVAPQILLTYNALSTESTFFGYGFSERNFRWIDQIDSMTAEIHRGDGRVLTYTNKTPSGQYTPPPGAIGELVKTGSTWQETRPNGFKLDYNSSGDLVKTTSVSGAINMYLYDGTPPRLETVIDPAGRRTTYTYTGMLAKKIESITDPAGRVTQIEINGSDNLVKFTTPELCVTSLTYDGQHRITSIIDPEGNRSTFGYDNTSSKMTKFEDAKGNKFTFSYSGSTTVMQDANGNVDSLTYDDDYNLLSRENALGAIWTYTWEDGFVKTAQDPLGNITTYSHESTDFSGPRLKSIERPLGQRTTYHYDANDRLSSYETPLGFRTTSIWNGSGQKTASVDPLGNRTSYSYNTFNQVESVTNPLGAITTRVFDGLGNQIGIVNPLGYRTSFTYNDAGQAISTEDALGNRTTSTFDDMNRVTSKMDSLGFVSTFTYNNNGKRLSATNPLGNTTTQTFDSTNRLISRMNPHGETTTIIYDADSRVEATENPLGFRTTNVFDNANRQIASIDSLGFRVTDTYDAAGRQVSSMDANGNISTSVYDRASQVIASVNAMGQRISNVYDVAGRIIAMENPRGFRTTSVFDSRNLKTENIDPLGRITTSLYDVAGRQTVRLDGRGNATTFSYDLDNRNIGRAYPDGSMVTFSFDMVSNRIAMQDSTGNYSFQYTARNQMESATTATGRTVTYAFDSVGLLSRLADSAGRVMTYQYDDASRLKFIQEIDGGRTTFAYDAASRRVLKQLANGTRASYTYNSASQLIEHANLKSDDTVLSDFQFGYDNAGNRLTTLENTGDRVTWTYDSVYQLTGDDRSGTGAYQRSFGYDANGNRLVKVAGGETTTSTFDGADQLSTSEDSSGITNYSYDDNGNQSLSVTPKGERTTSTWGYENQVELVALPSGQLVTATYNADNRRVRKANDNGVINFNWDPVNDNVLLETDETDAVTAEYTIIPVPFGEPLSQNRSNVLSFFHFDGNQSTRQLSGSSQIVTDASMFTGYGERILRTGTTINPFGYKGAVGYYENSATGDIYVRARTYQTIIGSWLSMDPLGFEDGALYRGCFVPNGSDPSGLSPYMDCFGPSLFKCLRTTFGVIYPPAVGVCISGVMGACMTQFYWMGKLGMKFYLKCTLTGALCCGGAISTVILAACIESAHKKCRKFW